MHVVKIIIGNRKNSRPWLRIVRHNTMTLIILWPRQLPQIIMWSRHTVSCSKTKWAP